MKGLGGYHVSSDDLRKPGGCLATAHMLWQFVWWRESELYSAHRTGLDGAGEQLSRPGIILSHGAPSFRPRHKGSGCRVQASNEAVVPNLTGEWKDGGRPDAVLVLPKPATSFKSGCLWGDSGRIKYSETAKPCCKFHYETIFYDSYIMSTPIIR